MFCVPFLVLNATILKLIFFSGSFENFLQHIVILIFLINLYSTTKANLNQSYVCCSQVGTLYVRLEREFF